MIRKSGANYEAIRTDTGAIAFTSTTPDIITLLNSIGADSNFKDGDLISIKPSATAYNCGATTASASFPKDVVIWGYGVTLKANTARTTSYMINNTIAGKRLTIYGLTLDLNSPNAATYQGAIRGAQNVDVESIRLYDVTIKNTSDYGVRVGTHNGTLQPTTNLVLERCKFINDGTNPSSNAMIYADSIERFSMNNCFIDNNIPFTISSRNAAISNLEVDATGYASGIAPASVSSEYMWLGHMRFTNVGLALRNFQDVTAGTTRHGTCRNMVVDGYSTTGSQQALLIEPFNATTARIENCSLRNLNLGDSGVRVQQFADGTTQGKVDMLSIQDLVLQDFDGNACFVYVRNCDLSYLGLYGAKAVASWAAGGAPVRVNDRDVDVTIENIDVRNVVPPDPTNVVAVADGGAGRTATLTVRRPLDSGSTTVFTTGSGGTVDVKFREYSGTSNITSAATAVSPTHNLRYTPSLGDIRVTPTTNLASASKFWVSAVGATTFTITVDSAPGSTITFAWKIRRN